MTWTQERKRRAGIEAPLDSWLTRPDTEVTSREGWYSLRTPSAPGALLNEVILSQVERRDAERVVLRSGAWRLMPPGAGAPSVSASRWSRDRAGPDLRG